MPGWNKIYKLSGRLVPVSYSRMMIWQQKLSKPRVVLFCVEVSIRKDLESTLLHLSADRWLSQGLCGWVRMKGESTFFPSLACGKEMWQPVECQLVLHWWEEAWDGSGTETHVFICTMCSHCHFLMKEISSYPQSVVFTFSWAQSTWEMAQFKRIAISQRNLLSTIQKREGNF